MIKPFFFTKLLFLLPLFGGLLFITSCNKQQNYVYAQSNVSTPANTSKLNSNSENNQEENNHEIKDPDKIIFNQPEIISREDWKANKPLGKGKVHEIKFITIHHTATKQKPNTPIARKLKNLQNFSQTKAKLANGKIKPAWLDVPYHFYISVDGKIGEGREIKFAGDTNTSYDPTGHALIVIEGNFEIELPNDRQIESLKNLTFWLAQKYYVSKTDIKAHNDYTSTACPGKNLKKIIPRIKEGDLIRGQPSNTQTR
jgi:hypothetical protein